MELFTKICSLMLLKMILSCPGTFGSIPCPPTWETFQGTGYYVHLSPHGLGPSQGILPANWRQPVMPKSSGENTFANSLLREHRATRAWLNCHKINSWLCEVNGVGQWPPFNNPASDQPYPEGNCVTVKTADRMWRNTLCDLEATAVCEREATVLPASPVMYCLTVGADGRPADAHGQCVHHKPGLP